MSPEITIVSLYFFPSHSKKDSSRYSVYYVKFLKNFAKDIQTWILDKVTDI